MSVAALPRHRGPPAGADGADRRAGGRPPRTPTSSTAPPAPARAPRRAPSPRRCWPTARTIRSRCATALRNGTHPDLTWVRPSGAHVMRVEDVEGPVVSAATRTPFEAKRRVFVLERVDTMNDEVANRLLKTLEEPAYFVHVILLTEALGRVLDTVVSRCQLVRFDPLPAARIAAALEAEGVPAERALACAGLSLGNATRARFLASDGGRELRAEVGRFVAAALHGGDRASRGGPCWSGPSAPARWPRTRPRRSASSGWSWSRRGASGGRWSASWRRPRKREGRRARTAVLDLALTLTELAFRDLVCVAEGAPEAVLAVDSPARPRRRGAGARRAPPARGGRALRADAAVAGAQRDRGAGALGARVPAGGARGRAGLARFRRGQVPRRPGGLLAVPSEGWLGHQVVEADREHRGGEAPEHGPARCAPAAPSAAGRARRSRPARRRRRRARRARRPRAR